MEETGGIKYKRAKEKVKLLYSKKKVEKTKS